MNKLVLTAAVLMVIGGNVFATDLVTGPVEPNTTAPVVSGYNSAALGVNTTVNGTSTIVLGRDNVVNADNTTVIGSNNGTINSSQSTYIGYNNKSLDDAREQTLIGANSSVGGQGAMVIGTHSTASAIDAVAIGNNAIADYQNSVALGTNSVTDAPVPTGQIMINGTTHVFAGENPNSVVSVGANGRPGAGGVTYYTRQITNVAAGQIDSSSTDAVNGSQLFAVADEVNTNGKAIKKLGNVVDQHTTQIQNNTKAIQDNSQNIQNLTSNVNNRFTLVNNTIATQNEHIGENRQAISQNTERINNHEVRISNLENQIGNGISTVMHEVAKAGAANAALSALHWTGFDADNKASYSVGYGHYKDANAVALGAFYAPNENIMFGLATTLGAAKMVNAAINFKIGKASNVKRDEYQSMKDTIAELTAKVNYLLGE